MAQFKILEWSQSATLADQYTRSALLAQNYTKEEVAKLMPVTKEDWAFGSTVVIEDALIPEELTTDFLKKNVNNPPAFHP